MLFQLLGFLSMRVGWIVHMMVSYLPSVDDFVDQWDPSTATSMEEVCRSWGNLLKK